MPVQTHIDKARTRVRAEREAVDAKLDAIDGFIARIGDLSTASVPPSTETIAAGGGLVQAESATEDRCRTVRTVFAGTIRSHSVADVDDPEPLLETIREEFTDRIAVALAPTTETPFTTGLKQLVIAKARTRRAETAALRQALAREGAHLDDDAGVIDDVTAWIVEANETPLTDLGFGALKERHGTLASHRDRCEELAHQRQEFLQGTTNDGVEAGVRHESLLPYLYQDFPVDHPVLATVASLDDVCSECQRAVRAHLVRRA